MRGQPTDRDDEERDEPTGDDVRREADTDEELAASPAAGVLDPDLPDPPEPSEPA
jgi:hypothetical protein